MIKLDNLTFKPEYTNYDVNKKIASLLKVNETEINKVITLKKSIDARRKPDVKIVLSVAVELNTKKSVKGFENVEPDFFFAGQSNL